MYKDIHENWFLTNINETTVPWQTCNIYHTKHFLKKLLNTKFSVFIFVLFILGGGYFYEASYTNRELDKNRLEKIFLFYFKVSVLKKTLKQQSYCMEIRDLSNLKVKTFAIQFPQLK